MKEGHDKSSAIAICYNSIISKKKVAILNTAIYDVELEVGAKIMPSSCMVCGDKAANGIIIQTETLTYCDKHLDGAITALQHHNLPTNIVIQGDLFSIGSKVILVEDEDEDKIELQVPEQPNEPEVEHVRAMVALHPPIELAGQISMDGYELPENLHITLVGFNETDYFVHQYETLQGVIAGFASCMSPFEANLNGVSRFVETHLPDKDAFVLNVDAPELADYRGMLKQTLERLGFDCGSWHGFTPHLTLAYVPKNEVADYEGPIPVKVVFDKLYLHWNDEVFEYPMGELATLSGMKAEPDIAAYLATKQKKADAKKIQSDMLDAWNESTMDSPKAMNLQIVTAKTFNLALTGEMNKAYEKNKADWGIQLAIGAMYEYTQERLAAKGYYREKVIPLYHPYVSQEANTRSWKVGDTVRIKLNPLSSWTTNIREAATYAQYFGSPGKPAYVFKTFLPAKSIISTPETGFGEKGTGEVVAAGGEYTALVELRYEGN